MKRIVSILAVISLAFCLFSCGETEWDEAEIIAAAERLIPLSLTVNDVFYGSGIPKKEGGRTNGIWTECDPESLEELGVSSVSDLRALAREVYSESVCELLDSTVLTSITSGESIVAYAKYFDFKIDAAAGDKTLLMVQTEKTQSYFDTTVNYDFSSIKVVNAKGGKVKSKTGEVSITIDVWVIKEGFEPYLTNNSLTFVYENFHFALDSLTGMRYNRTIH